MEEQDPGLEVVPLYGSWSRRRCQEFALVLAAAGIGCEVLPDGGRYVLAVRARDAGAARAELGLYGQEQRSLPPRFAGRLDARDGIVAASLYGATILLFDIAQRNGLFGLDWWGAGMSRAGPIHDGEWWRAVTALALHADRLHLVGNLAFGTVFGFLAGGALGWGPALAGMVFAGALGNLLNAALRDPGHASVGASTAVFAIVGILAAHTWKRRRRPVNRWVPLAGGATLLALLGMSGERTDILAHVMGFAAGGLFGLAWGALEDATELAPWHRHAPGIAAILLFALAWAIALRAWG